MSRPDPNNPNQPTEVNRRTPLWRDCFRSALHARILLGDAPQEATAAAAEYADLAYVHVMSPRETTSPKDRPMVERPAIAQVGAVRAHPTS
jgi:hypothetical protein